MRRANFYIGVFLISFAALMQQIVQTRILSVVVWYHLAFFVISLAMFDGAARAVRCAAAIRDVAAKDELRIRAGVHSGEVERQADNVRGVAVHAVTRIAALAEPGEVLVSEPAANLLEGSDLDLEDAGEHELKGLPGRRRMYRLAQGEGS